MYVHVLVYENKKNIWYTCTYIVASLYISLCIQKKFHYVSVIIGNGNMKNCSSILKQQNHNWFLDTSNFCEVVHSTYMMYM